MFKERGFHTRAAWFTGWTVYMIAMALWSYDGPVSLIFQTIIGAVVASFFVAVVRVVGFALSLEWLGRAWDRTPSLAIGLVAASLAVMAFGSSAGLTDEFTDPDTGRTFAALHPAAALLSYLTLLFVVGHWPEERPPAQPA